MFNSLGPLNTGSIAGPIDTNWLITSTPNGPTLLNPSICDSLLPPWISYQDVIQWIAPSCNETQSADFAGYFTYQTTFTLPSTGYANAFIPVNYTAYDSIVNMTLIHETGSNTYIIDGSEVSYQGTLILSAPFSATFVLEIVVSNDGIEQNRGSIYVSFGTPTYSCSEGFYGTTFCLPCPAGNIWHSGFGNWSAPSIQLKIACFFSSLISHLMTWVLRHVWWRCLTLSSWL